ncbi:MAG: DUF309 domain-containing protein [Isosphaeraceae bacterium]
MASDRRLPGDWPPHAYVPGGPWPHPGHSSPIIGSSPCLGETGDWHACPAYLEGFRLFNAGYYWEAHEVWEVQWNAEGRRGCAADLLRALIKLAAAGVKVREGQAHGVTTHATRAAQLLRSIQAETGPRFLGLDLPACEAFAERVASTPWRTFPLRDEPVVRVFDWVLAPSAEQSQ